MSKEHEEYLRKIKKDNIKIIFFRISLFLIFILLWEALTRLKILDPFLTSSPSRIVNSFKEFIQNGTLFTHIGITLYETILGFTLGTVIGFLIALLLWLCPRLSKVLDPYLVVLNALPKVALAPIILFWIGTGTSTIITMALLISLVTTILNILTSFNEIDSEKLLLMKTLHASKLQTVLYLILPASVPSLIATLKINVGLSWVGVIMGEFLVAREGLGFLIVYGGQISQLDMVMMSIVILSIIAFIMYKIINVFEVYFMNKR
ncbi:MAG: ABC transporter permease [Clostridium sp.]|uniref:ABC transporter permease n=1 Tax=Clostridium sp. TaxID=1506 RepID=UPI003EE7F702